MWTIYLKELLELTRDRKTLIFTILIPIFAMPLIFGGFAYVSSNMFKNARIGRAALCHLRPAARTGTGRALWPARPICAWCR